MMLRWLVTQFAQQTVRDRVQQQLRGILTGSEAAQDSNGETQETLEPLPPAEVLVLFAVAVESQGLVDSMARVSTARSKTGRIHAGLLAERSIVVAESGMGTTAAAQALESLLDKYPVSWVVSTGFAGGLQPHISRGDFIMPDQVIATDHRCLNVGLRLGQETLDSTPGLHTGRLLTVDHLVREPDEKRRLGEEHEAIACDMETSAVADVCRRRGVRFLSVRIISDGVEDALPRDVERLVQQRSTSAKLGAATGALFRRPGAAKDLWRLYDDAVRSSKRLSSFLDGVVRQLPS